MLQLRPALQLSQTNFTQTPADWDARYLAAQSVWSLEPNQFVVEDLGELSPGVMVDIAGGEGRNALWFAQRGWQVENVEFSSVALEKFLQRAQDQKLQVHANHSDARTAAFILKPSLAVIAYLQLPFAQLALALDNALSQMSHGVLYGVWHARENLNEGYGGPQAAEVLPSVAELNQWLATNQLEGEVKLRRREVSTEAGNRIAIDVTLLASL